MGVLGYQFIGIEVKGVKDYMCTVMDGSQIFIGEYNVVFFKLKGYNVINLFLSSWLVCLSNGVVLGFCCFLLLSGWIYSSGSSYIFGQWKFTVFVFV